MGDDRQEVRAQPLQLLEHVLDPEDRMRAVGEQSVRARVFRLERMPRHDHHLAPRAEREQAVDQGPGPPRGLDDDHDARQPRDDPVAPRERPAGDRHAVRELPRDAAPLPEDARRELAVRRRHRHVVPAGHDRDRRAPHLERAPVRGRVDPDRATAHDHDPRGREAGPQPLPHLEPEARRPARAHDRDRGLRQERLVPADVEDLRSVLERQEEPGVTRVRPGDRARRFPGVSSLAHLRRLPGPAPRDR